jgi:hypothetical protein
MKSNKTKKNHKKNGNKTHKVTNRNFILLKNETPQHIDKLSSIVDSSLRAQGQGHGIRDLTNLQSYAPTINKFLVPLQTLPRENITSCNYRKAFLLKEPLKISLPNKEGECVPYDNALAKEFLLKKLSANKHIHPTKIIPPVQALGNCWFNTMFVTFFVSDKGRKFFHFFRSLMIEGKQANGRTIEPVGLRDAFALLNFAVECCLTGSEYAYKLDTNHIIKKIYSTISQEHYHYIVDADVASNPVGYYMNIIHYLNNNSLQIAYLKNIMDWRRDTMNYVETIEHLPHLIILEIYDGPNETAGTSGKIKDKPLSFQVKGATYKLDSCVIRDTEQIHFCSLLTSEGREYAYDGMSYHRLSPFSWKKKINKSVKWSFQGSKNVDGNLVKWSFKHGYQLLFYYRV